MKSEFFIVIYLFIILTSSEAAKILAVLPTPSISHQVVFRPFVLELVARGHEVTVITPDPAYPAGGGPTNLTEIDINEIYQDFEIEKHPAVNEYAAIRIAIKKGILNVTKAFNKQLNTDILKKFILDGNIEFDLLIIEAWLRPTLAFSYRFNVPVIRFGSVGSFLSEYNDMLGFGHPLFHPTNLCSRCPNIENLTFLEKIYEIYNYVYINTFYYSKEDEETETLRAIFGPEMPALSELSNNIDLYISNVYRTWELNRPMPLSVIQVGGIHLKTECMLPEDLQNYLDSSMNGVVYISFGTNMKTSWLDPEKLGMMVNVLSQIPMDVLWKWDEDELPGRTENIRISKWLPQECLLRHPKIKLFITQGGLQSTEEAMAAGVPLVGIPIIADQFANVQNYVRHRIGVKLTWNDFTEEGFRDAIHSVWKDESYRRNIVRLRALLHDERLPPLARAVWWTEHVLRHAGTPYLRAPAANMHWAHYYQLDLIVLLAAVALLACYAVYTGAKILLRLVWRNCSMFLARILQIRRIEEKSI